MNADSQRALRSKRGKHSREELITQIDLLQSQNKELSMINDRLYERLAEPIQEIQSLKMLICQKDKELDEYRQSNELPYLTS